MNQVRWRQMGRQLDQVLAFLLEGFSGYPARFGHGPVLQPDSRPLKGLLVHVFQAFKTAARQEVCLDGPKTALLPRLSVGMALFMANEAESILAGEGFHLWHDNGVLA